MFLLTSPVSFAWSDLNVLFIHCFSANVGHIMTKWYFCYFGVVLPSFRPGDRNKCQRTHCEVVYKLKQNTEIVVYLTYCSLTIKSMRKKQEVHCTTIVMTGGTGGLKDNQ